MASNRGLMLQHINGGEHTSVEMTGLRSARFCNGCAVVVNLESIHSAARSQVDANEDMLMLMLILILMLMLLGSGTVVRRWVSFDRKLERIVLFPSFSLKWFEILESLVRPG